MPPKATDAVLVEVDQYVRPKAKRPTATTKLFETGAWTLDFVSVEGEVTTRTGCLKQVQVDRLRDDLKAATWKLVHRAVTCRSDSPRITIYKLAGVPVYQERACSEEVVGRADQDVLDLISMLVPIPNLDSDDSRPCLENPLARGCR